MRGFGLTENYRCSTKPGPPHNPGHNFVHTEAEAAVAAMKAGTDMNCGCEYAAHLADAVGNGTVTHEEIDLAAGGSQPRQPPPLCWHVFGCCVLAMAVHSLHSAIRIYGVHVLVYSC